MSIIKTPGSTLRRILESISLEKQGNLPILNEMMKEVDKKKNLNTTDSMYKVIFKESNL